MQEMNDSSERPREGVEATAAHDQPGLQNSLPIVQPDAATILNHSGFDDETADVKVPDAEPGSESTELARQERAVQEPDLVERMRAKRDEYAQFRAQFAQFRYGYNIRLYEFFQFAYEMDEAFRLNPGELSRFKKEEFFDCNRRKPKETNLLRHNLYFLTDARTDLARDKLRKPAKVLMHFRRQGVPANEVAQRLKKDRGYKRIFGNIAGKLSATDLMGDDLDILWQDSDVVQDQSSDLEFNIGADDESPRFSDADSDEGRAAAATKMPDQGIEVAQPGGTPVAEDRPANIVVSAKVATEYGEAISGQAQVGTSRTRPPVTLADRENIVAVVIPPYDPSSPFAPFNVKTVTQAKRGVIFFEVKPTSRDDWNDVTAVRVETFDDSMPWPELVDPRMLSRRADRNEPRVSTNEPGVGVAPIEKSLSGNELAGTPSDAPSADAGHRNLVSTDTEKAIPSPKTLSPTAHRGLKRPKSQTVSKVFPTAKKKTPAKANIVRTVPTKRPKR